MPPVLHNRFEPGVGILDDRIQSRPRLGTCRFEAVRRCADGVAEYVVDRRHLQGYGIVHGGMHSGAIETVCSTGAALDAMARGLAVVGVENNTSFVRAVREGRIRVTARPITRGRRSQLWEAVARDEQERIVSCGRVRLLCLEPGSDLGGKPAPSRPSA